MVAGRLVGFRLLNLLLVNLFKTVFGGLERPLRWVLGLNRATVELCSLHQIKKENGFILIHGYIQLSKIEDY